MGTPKINELERLLEQLGEHGPVAVRLDELQAAVNQESVDRRREIRAQERTQREAVRRQWLALSAAFVAVVGALVMGAIALDTTREIEQVRSRNQASSCADANVMRVAHNRLTLDIAGFDPDTGLPLPDGWGRLDDERRERLRPRLVRNLLGPRLCTVEGIEAFYESGGEDGTVPIEPDGDDYSEAVTVP